MIVLGIVLLVVGALAGIGVLTTLGEILVVIGVILLITGHFHGPVVGERRYWW